MKALALGNGFGHGTEMHLLTTADDLKKSETRMQVCH